MEYNSSIGRFQFIRSHESVFIQLADVLMGAINYNLRYEKGEVEGRVKAKMKLIEKIKNTVISVSTPQLPNLERSLICFYRTEIANEQFEYYQEIP